MRRTRLVRCQSPASRLHRPSRFVRKVWQWRKGAEQAAKDVTLDQILRAYAAQFTTMENANAIAVKAIRTCGGQAMLKSLSLERIFKS